MFRRSGRAVFGRRTLRSAIVGLWLGAAWIPASAEPLADLRFERIGTEGGPPPAVITSLLQDRDGFVWIGSRNGLTLFDGYTYTNFQPDPSDPGSLSDSTVRTMYEDHDGTLWFGTNTGGLDRLDPAARSFVHYRHDGANPRSLSHDSVYAVLRDRRGRLWVGTQKGLNRMEPGSQDFLRMSAGGAEGLVSDYILSLYEDRSGRIWVGTLDGGLCRWDEGRRRFDVYRHDPSNPATTLVNDRVIALIEDDANGLWVGTLRGLSRFDPGSDTFRNLDTRPEGQKGSEDQLITSFAPGAAGRIWAGTHGGGLAELETATGRLRFWKHDAARPASLSDDVIIALLTDHSGALWVGTWGGGLNRLPATAQPLTGPDDGGFPPAGVRSRDVTALLCSRDGSTWVGTRNGYLLRLDPATRHWETILRGGDEGKARILSALSEDRLGRIWVGTSGGLLRFDPATGATREWEHDRADPKSLGPGYVSAVLTGRAGELWVGTGEGGLQRLNADGAVLQRFVHDPRDPESLSDDYVTAVLEDRRGHLWVGTRSGGLNEFDPATGKAIRFLPVAGDPKSLGHHYVTSLLEDASGRLWVGTGGGGLNRVDRSEVGRVRFERVNEQRGLIDDDVTGVLEGDDGSLWVTTRRGLSRFDPARNAFTNLFASDGLPSAEFEAGAVARSRSSLCFGSVRGLVIFAAGTAFRTSSPSPVVVRSMRTTAGEVLGRNLAREPKRVELPHGSWLSIELAVLDYSPELEHRYAYKLEKEWIDIGSRREITFTSLPNGTHALRVRGRNSQGVWGEASAPLQIIVVPPFWMTWRFRLLTAAAVVALAFGAHRRRTSALEKRNRDLLDFQRQREKARQELDDAYQRLRRLTSRLEVAKEDERKRIARELHDDMGPSLTAVIINLRLLPGPGTPDQLVVRIEETIDLVDRMIQRIRDMSLDLRPPLIDELGLVPALSGYLENVSARSGIKISIRGGKDVGPLPANLPITVFRVVQEAITNVIRHAGPCHVEVSIRRRDLELDVSVEDDGKGFDVEETMDRASAGHAIGLLGMQERVAMAGGVIEFDSIPGEGTRIHVRLPLPEAA